MVTELSNSYLSWSKPYFSVALGCLIILLEPRFFGLSVAVIVFPEENALVISYPEIFATEQILPKLL